MDAVTNASSNDRFQEEGDWLAHNFFSTEDLQLSPDEYAARHLQNWGCFSLHFHPFRDSALGAWVRRVGELFSNPEELERCRQQYLTPQELAEVRRQAAEGF